MLSMNWRQEYHLSPFHPAGVDVRGPHGGHPLLQGGPHLQEVCALQSPRRCQPGPGKLAASLEGVRGGGLAPLAEQRSSKAPGAAGQIIPRCAPTILQEKSDVYPLSTYLCDFGRLT